MGVASNLLTVYKQKMEFGISLDPSSVPQRHALYDSDEEDEQIDTQQADFVFQPSTLDSIHKNNTLVVAIGQTACIFAKSLFTLSPLSTLEASTRGIFQGTYFPKTGEASCLVSELMCADEGDAVFCLHENSLKPEHVNAWFKKVNCFLHVFTHKLYLHSFRAVLRTIICLKSLQFLMSCN